MYVFVCVCVCYSLNVRLSEQTNVDRSNLNDGGGLQYCHCSIGARDRVSWVTLIQTSKDRIRKDEQHEWMSGGKDGTEDPRESPEDGKSADIQKDKNVSVLYCCTIRPSAHGFYCLCVLHTLHTPRLQYNVIRVMYTLTQRHTTEFIHGLLQVRQADPWGVIVPSKAKKQQLRRPGIAGEFFDRFYRFYIDYCILHHSVYIIALVYIILFRWTKRFYILPSGVNAYALMRTVDFFLFLPLLPEYYVIILSVEEGRENPTRCSYDIYYYDDIVHALS